MKPCIFYFICWIFMKCFFVLYLTLSSLQSSFHEFTYWNLVSHLLLQCVTSWYIKGRINTIWFFPGGGWGRNRRSRNALWWSRGGSQRGSCYSRQRQQPTPRQHELRGCRGCRKRRWRRRWRTGWNQRWNQPTTGRWCPYPRTWHDLTKMMR